MKVELLCLDKVIKPSPISEGVMEIRIDSQPCKGNNLTTQQVCAMKAPRVARVHNVIKELGRVLPSLLLSSTQVPRWTIHG
jgi:hypothetical protein